MESLKGGVSFKVNFINSGDNPGNSSGESQRLIGIYNGDWSLGRNGAVNASMAFARRAGDIRSHGNLIERLYGLGERSDPMSRSGTYKLILTKLFVPDSLENNQSLEVVRVALRVGAVALHCSGLSLEELRKSPTEHFPSGEVDKLVSCFHGNVDFGNEWQEYKKMAREL